MVSSNTPTLRALGYAIERATDASTSVLVSVPTPPEEAVVAAMQRSTIVHLACHGVSDWSDPGASRLFHFGPAPQLVDQTLHITSAIQLIGDRHVIGALWPVDDRSARMIAATLYTRLMSTARALLSQAAWCTGCRI